jgi:hypothetical protein
MRILKHTVLACLLGGLGAINSHGQYTFNCGSDGSYGAMNITTNTTLAMPTNGIFNCTTITIATNATLTFTPNALNTPVYLLATGNVAINGTIDVSGSLGTGNQGGAGGPGGFAGGKPSNGSLPAGDGNGPGAGRAGNSGTTPCVGSAGYGSAGGNIYSTTNNGAAYGSPLLIPLVGGSGGGGRSDGTPGEGGGGAVLIGSNTRIDVFGSISASSAALNSGYNNFGYGSGGAIRLVAPVVGDGGTVNVAGGLNNYPYFGNPPGGGNGRIRIDCMDRRSLALTYNSSSAVSIGANMVVFLANLPHLDITQVAGTNIPVGTNSPVFFTLPQGSSTNQNVIVQASNFSNSVPIRVVLTPDNGSLTSYDTQIDNTTVNPASVTVPVVLPVNVQVQVNAWTR